MGRFFYFYICEFTFSISFASRLLPFFFFIIFTVGIFFSQTHKGYRAVYIKGLVIESHGRSFVGGGGGRGRKRRGKRVEWVESVSNGTHGRNFIGLRMADCGPWAVLDICRSTPWRCWLPFLLPKSEIKLLVPLASAGCIKKTYMGMPSGTEECYNLYGTRMKMKKKKKQIKNKGIVS